MVLGYEQFFASRTITYFVIEKNHPEYLHRLLIIIGRGVLGGIYGWLNQRHKSRWQHIGYLTDCTNQLSKTIVEIQGGEIILESEVENGSTVILRFHSSSLRVQ